MNFEYIRDNADKEALSQFADTLRTIPHVSERLAGLEQADFRKRPSLGLDDILTQPGAIDTVERALIQLLNAAPTR